MSHPYRQLLEDLASAVWKQIDTLGREKDDFVAQNPDIFFYKALFNL